MPGKLTMSRNLQEYSRQTNIRLFIGFIVILLVVGIGLIYHFYGAGGALVGLVCLAAGLVPLLLIALALWGMEWLVKRGEDE